MTIPTGWPFRQCASRSWNARGKLTPETHGTEVRTVSMRRAPALDFDDLL